MNRRHFFACHLACPAVALAAGSALAAMASWAAAQTAASAGTELAGVRYPGTVRVSNQTLRLNGAGIRYRFVVKVYTAGLYLTTAATTPEAVLAAPGPKRLHVVMLRDIDANELGRLFTRGMQDNSPREEFSKSIPGTLRMAEIFSAKKRLKEGENFSVDWTPGEGTQVLVNGRPQGDPIKEPEFFQALMRIWLGQNPADNSLKDALLGAAPPRPVTNPGQQ
jgi:hypothetical protein